MGACLQRHLPTCRLQNELLTLGVGRTFISEHQTEPNTLTVPILADINLTEEVFQKEESDRFARLSVLEGNPSAISGGGGDAGNSRWPYPVPLQRLVEEVKHREAPKRETHLTWATACVILLPTVQFLSMARSFTVQWEEPGPTLYTICRSNSAPATRTGEQTLPGNFAAKHNKAVRKTVHQTLPILSPAVI